MTQKSMRVRFWMTGGCVFVACIAAIVLTAMCVGPTLCFERLCFVRSREPQFHFGEVFCTYLKVCVGHHALPNDISLVVELPWGKPHRLCALKC
jgi:hypothetical protein